MYNEIKHNLIAFMILLITLTFIPGLLKAEHNNQMIPMNFSNDRMPVIFNDYFIQNLGQIDAEDIQFYTCGGDIFFSPNGITYKLMEIEPIEEEYLEGGHLIDPMRTIPIVYHERGVVLKYSFIGANKVIPEGRERCTWNTNYFKGNDPEDWYTNVPNYMEIIYPQLWDGIDLVYRLNAGATKYDLIVHPEADPTQIRFRVEGHTDLDLNSAGDLVISTYFKNLIDTGLVAFYGDNLNERVGCNFKITSPDTYSFDLDSYDRSRELVIDPLTYSTFIGGSGLERGYGIAIDSIGNTYIVGGTMDDISDYPTTSGAYCTVHNGIFDVFVTKLNSTGNSLIFSTLIGGGGWDEGWGIALDSSGNPYITGYASDDLIDYPTTGGAYDTTQNGGSDVFVTKLDSTGSSLLFSTFIGGNIGDEGHGIVLDPSEDIYVTGFTDSANYPTTDGAFDTSLNGGDDVFITKLKSDGSSIIYSTFIGGNGADGGCKIALDSNENAYVTGITEDGTNDYPTTFGSYDRTQNGNRDAFLTKLDPTGSSLIYSTFIGGTNGDVGYGIYLDSNGNAHLTGYTDSTNFPTTIGAYDTGYNGGSDIFTTKVNSLGSSLIYSTFIGGSWNDEGWEIAIDSSGNACIIGYAESANYPTTNGAYDTTYNGNWDVIMTELNSAGSFLSYSTFLGGNGEDKGYGFVIDSNSDILITGYSQDDTIDYPTTDGAFKRIHSGVSDVIVTKLNYSFESIPPTFGKDGTSSEATTGEPFLFEIDVMDNIGISSVDVEYWFGSDTSITESMTGAGTFTYTITIPLDSIDTLHYIFHAIDMASNWNQTRQKDIMVVDNDKPNFGTDSTEDSYITNAQFIFEIGASDNVEISNVFIEYWFGSGSSINESMTGTDTFTYAITISPYFTETLHYIFHANDTSDNWNQTVQRNVSLFDIDRPIFGMDSTPIIGYTGDQLAFKIEVIDNVAISSVYVEYWFGSGIHNNASMSYSESYTYQIMIPSDSVDLLYYIFRACDGAGNWADSPMNTILVLDSLSPNANAGLDRIIDEDTIVSLNGSESTDNIMITNWTWLFNDGTKDVILFGLEVGYIFTNPGIYVITLNVTDDDGNWAIDVMNITVRDITSPIAIAGPDRTIEEDVVFIFDGSSCYDNVGIINWTWKFIEGDKDIILYGVSLEYIFITPGIYNITLTVRDIVDNMEEDTFLVTVRDITKPMSDAGPDRNVLKSTSVTLDGSGSTDNVGIVNYTWSFKESNEPIILYGMIVEYNFSLPGNYSITLMVKDGEGNTGIDTMIVSVGEIPPNGDIGDESSIVDYWWIAIIVIIILIGIFIVVFLITRAKNEKVRTENILPKEENSIIDGDKLSQIKRTNEE